MNRVLNIFRLQSIKLLLLSTKISFRRFQYQFFRVAEQWQVWSLVHVLLIISVMDGAELIVFFNMAIPKHLVDNKSNTTVVGFHLSLSPNPLKFKVLSINFLRLLTGLISFYKYQCFS